MQGLCRDSIPDWKYGVSETTRAALLIFFAMLRWASDSGLETVPVADASRGRKVRDV